MNYIVYDIEYNQPTFFGRRKFNPNPIAPFEIIEIGAVKLDCDLNITDTFKMFIKPRIYRMLSPIVIRKTKITKKDLEDAFGFHYVFKCFKKWVGNEYILCTWGSSDIIEMKRNCKYHNLNGLRLENYIDIQKLYMYKNKLPAGQQIGLKTAMENEDIVIESRLHRALNDALYTSLIFQKVFSAELLNEYENEINLLKMKKVKVYRMVKDSHS